jgi:hypothetical protein
MMMDLLAQRCVLHPDREAAVRCPGCERFYCRECVTEHRGRMMCSHCVARFAAPSARKSSVGMMWILLCVGGLLFSWMLFYYLGMALARIPSSFHGGPS